MGAARTTRSAPQVCPCTPAKGHNLGPWGTAPPERDTFGTKKVCLPTGGAQTGQKKHTYNTFSPFCASATSRAVLCYTYTFLMFFFIPFMPKVCYMDVFLSLISPGVLYVYFFYVFGARPPSGQFWPSGGRNCCAKKARRKLATAPAPFPERVGRPTAKYR